MISKNFYLQLIFRVLLLAGFSLVFAFLLLKGHYFLCGLVLVILIVQVVLLIRYVNYSNRKIAYFFESIKNEDFTLRFPEKLRVKSLKELNKSLNILNEKIHNVYLKNQAQEKFYQEILRQADIGIMTINDKGHILFANPKMEKLLDYTPLNHIKQLNQIDASLYALFESLDPFDRKLFALTNEREKKQITLKATRFTAEKEALLIVVAQDIHKELDEKETGSWVKLIRVLTHEIMNTITPITSISDSIIKYFKRDGEMILPEQIDENTMKNAVRGLEVIKGQGADLMEFVQSYRSFLNLPKPDKVLIEAKRFLEKILVLTQAETQNNELKMELSVNPDSLEIYADEKQLSLVLINLMKNARHALEHTANGRINITAAVNDEGKKFIEVADNGPGIPKEIIDDIFVPFYTTKEKGTGIGLSLSKQIIHLHGGSLRVLSIPGKITTFTITFDS
ncbi:MAG: histidine kinase [Flavobacteriaceae bacterium]|nr:histidine kinase [Flavobacteriaceae bacterium]